MRPFAPSLRLGLIGGGHITATRAPALHMVCGLATGFNVTYDLIIPEERGIGFAEALEYCRAAGFDGVNVTHPYKELAVTLIEPASATVRAMGAANTIRFAASGARARAHNTDHSGFCAAWRRVLGDRTPGRVLQLGAGGVGRAIAFALADLGASEIVLCDTKPGKAATLAAAVRGHCGTAVTPGMPGALRDLDCFDGVVNATPVGMVGHEGSPLPPGITGHPKWAFDAVYTPAHTSFRGQMTARGAMFLSGYELYFHQGIDAHEIFSGTRVEEIAWVRATLAHRSADEYAERPAPGQ